jgi:hypothetical protein
MIIVCDCNQVESFDTLIYVCKQTTVESNQTNVNCENLAGKTREKRNVKPIGAFLGHFYLCFNLEPARDLLQGLGFVSRASRSLAACQVGALDTLHLPLQFVEKPPIL